MSWSFFLQYWFYVLWKKFQALLFNFFFKPSGSFLPGSKSYLPVMSLGSPLPIEQILQSILLLIFLTSLPSFSPKPLPIHFYLHDNLFHPRWLSWSKWPLFEEILAYTDQLQERELLLVAANKSHILSSLVTFWATSKSPENVAQLPHSPKGCASPPALPGRGHLELAEWKTSPTSPMFWCCWVCNQSTRQCLSWHIAVAGDNCPLCLSGLCRHF